MEQRGLLAIFDPRLPLILRVRTRILVDTLVVLNSLLLIVFMSGIALKLASVLYPRPGIAWASPEAWHISDWLVDWICLPLAFLTTAVMTASLALLPESLNHSAFGQTNLPISRRNRKR